MVCIRSSLPSTILSKILSKRDVNPQRYHYIEFVKDVNKWKDKSHKTHIRFFIISSGYPKCKTSGIVKAFINETTKYFYVFKYSDFQQRKFQSHYFLCRMQVLFITDYYFDS